MLKIAVLLLLACYGAAAIPFKTWNGTQVPPLNMPGPRIINGVDANDNQFPYMVSLNYVGDGHACGASIIGANWVLTAAHCCLTGSAMEVFAGSVVLSDGNGQRYGISKYLIHGDYDPDHGWRNDICVIQINGQFAFGNTIQQVTLPSQGWPVNEGDNVLISGWGYTTPDGEQRIPDRMQVGYNFRARSNQECGRLTNVDMYDGYLCVNGNAGQGVCGGDSGSPLMKDGVQVGIASWVFLPCGNGLPDFFTRVPNYVDWIRQALGSQADQLKIAH